MARPAQPDCNGPSWCFLRILQVLTLIPAWAMLAAVIAHYNSNNQLTPSSIQFLFSIALILSVWSFCLLITFLRARNTALWITFFDIVGMILLIAAVVWMSNIANVECLVFNVVQQPASTNNGSSNSVIGDPYNNPGTKVYTRAKTKRLVQRAVEQITTAALRLLDKRQITYVDSSGNLITTRPLYSSQCTIIKAAWGLAIANIILFFITAILSAVIYGDNAQWRPVVREKIIVESEGPPAVGIAQPAPVYSQTVYGGSERYGGREERRYSGGRRHHGHQHRRGSRVGSDYYV